MRNLCVEKTVDNSDDEALQIMRDCVADSENKWLSLAVVVVVVGVSAEDVKLQQMMKSFQFNFFFYLDVLYRTARVRFNI